MSAGEAGMEQRDAAAVGRGGVLLPGPASPGQEARALAAGHGGMSAGAANDDEKALCQDAELAFTYRDSEARMRGTTTRDGQQVEYEVVACTRKARKDLRVAIDADPAAWQNLRAAVLCIGIDEYRHMPDLKNATRDARALCEKVNTLPCCRAQLLVDDLHDAASMVKEIRKFLKRLKESPPESVIINYSGHALQKGGDVYLLPGNSDPAGEYADPKREWLPIRDVFTYCREDLDRLTRFRSPVKEVSFVLLLDACRNFETDSPTLQTTLEPTPGSAPVIWGLCFSCSRDSTASDGPPGTHSPFVKELLDEDAGIFAAGVPLRKGLEAACDRVSEQHQGQDPIPCLHKIKNDWCLCPARLQQSATATVDPTDDVSTASTNVQPSQPSRPSEGHASPPTDDEPVPRIEGYVCDKKLGAGGQGTVWLARPRTDKGNRVAIKMCQKKYEQLQAREVENLLSLAHLKHPNIVKYIDFRKHECALIMEYVDGVSLSAYLQNKSGGRRSLEWDEASVVVRGILSGLKCLHRMEGGPMLHRDVKPDNVMLSATPGSVSGKWNVILVDFGLSKRMGVGQTVTVGEKMVGTPAYLSPEVLKGTQSRDLDSRVDVWAVGVVSYEMLTGEMPFTGENPYALMEAIRNNSVERITAAGAGGNAFLKKSLAKERESRFSDASDMLEVFETVCKDRHRVPEQLSGSRTEPTPRPGPPSPADIADIELQVKDDLIATGVGEPGHPVPIPRDEARQDPGGARSFDLSDILRGSCMSARRCDLCKSRRVVSVFGIGIDIDDDEDCYRPSQIQLSKDLGFGVKRIGFLQEKLSNASFDLAQINCAFERNPKERRGILDAIEEWQEGIKSSPLVPSLVLFLISAHELKAHNGIQVEAILDSLSKLEKRLKLGPNAPTDLAFLVIIDTMTHTETTGSQRQHESSNLVIINAQLPPARHALEQNVSEISNIFSRRGEGRMENRMNSDRAFDEGEGRRTRATLNGLTTERVLDKIFEPGMLLTKSLQHLEDDFSIENMQCVPQDFAVRESLKFDFSFEINQARGQKCQYIHIMIGHTMTSIPPEEDDAFKESLVGRMEVMATSEWRQATVATSTDRFAKRFATAQWPDSIVSRPTRSSETVCPLLIYAPSSRSVSSCEAQIFSILIRSVVYAPILSFEEGSKLRPQANGCCLVLLQHMLALELLGKKESALKAIYPVVFIGSAQSLANTLHTAMLDDFLKRFPQGFDEQTGKETYKVAQMLLGRIGISSKERTVRQIFEELFTGTKESTGGGGVNADVIAEKMLREVQTQIKNVKSHSFKNSCPQGEEVIEWLESIGWGGMSATFAECGLCSLLDIMNLPKERLRKICVKKAKAEEEDGDPAHPKDVLYSQLYSAIKDLKDPKHKFHEKAKRLGDRLDGFCDQNMSWAKALLAPHSLEILVSRKLSLTVLSFLLLGAAAAILSELVFAIWVVTKDIPANHGNERVWTNAVFRHYIMRLIFNALMACVLPPAAWTLLRAPWKNPKDVARKFQLWIGIGLCVFILRHANETLLLCFLWEPPDWYTCPDTQPASFAVDCYLLGFLIVEIVTLIVKPQYFVICGLGGNGIMLTLSGFMYLQTYAAGTDLSNHIRRFSIPTLGVVLLLTVMLLLYKKKKDAEKLSHAKRQPTVNYNKKWTELLKGGNMTFVRAKLVVPRNTEGDVAISLEENIRRLADAHHIIRTGSSRAGPTQDSWLIEMLGRIRVKLGMMEEISVSMRLKRCCSEDDVRECLESAMGGHISHRWLNMWSHKVPASLASLNVLCDKIIDNLALQRLQDDVYERSYDPQWCLRQVTCLSRTGKGETGTREGAEAQMVRYSTGGKRLQHTTSIEKLFMDAQLLNNEFHTEIKSLVQSYGDACEFIPGPIKTPSRAIEKVVRRYYRQPEHLTDLVRCRVVFKDIRSILAFVQDIQSRSWGYDSAATQDGGVSPRIFKICGLKNRLDPDDDAVKTFGFRDLQLNLEVGFKDGKIEPCQEPPKREESESSKDQRPGAAWGPGVRQHICEVQVLLKSFDEVLKKYEVLKGQSYKELRDMAGQ